MIIQYLSLIFVFSRALPLHSLTHKDPKNQSEISHKPLFSKRSRNDSGLVSEVSQKALFSKILGNASAFVSAMSQVDPTALESIITALKELKLTSESQEKSLLDALNTKIAELGTASNNVVKANEDLVLARESLAEKEKAKVEKEKIVVEKDIEKTDANKAYEDGKKNFDSEQQVLGDVIAQLENLLGEQSSRGEIVGGKGVLVTERSDVGSNWKFSWDMKITIPNFYNVIGSDYQSQYYRGTWLLWFYNQCNPNPLAGVPQVTLGNSGTLEISTQHNWCSDYSYNSNPGIKLEDWNNYEITITNAQSCSISMNGKEICNFRDNFGGCKDNDKKFVVFAGQPAFMPKMYPNSPHEPSGGFVIKNVNWVDI